MDYDQYSNPHAGSAGAAKPMVYEAYHGELDRSSDERVRTKPFDLSGKIVEAFDWAADFAIDIIPFAKYALRPEERKAFAEMSEGQQRNALLWEAAGAALWAAPIPTAWLGKQLAKVPARQVAKRAAKYIKPVEDIVGFPEENYVKGLRNTLRDTPLKIKEESEIAAVKDFLFGKTAALEARMSNFTKGKPSKAFQKIVQKERDEFGRMTYTLTEDAFEKLTPRAVRRQQENWYYRNTLYDKLRLNYKDKTQAMYDPKKTSLHEGLFPQIMKKLYGEVGLKKNLMTASTEEIMAARRYLRDPKALHLIKRTAEPGVSALMMRVPAAFAKGEVSFGTRSKVWDKVVKGLEDAQAYLSSKMKRLDEMLASRGLLVLGKDGAFKINRKRLNRSTEAGAQRVLETVAELERKLKLETVITERGAIKASMKNMIAEIDDPAVKDLIDVVVRFSDDLYEDFTVTWLRRTLSTRELKLTATPMVNKLVNDYQRRLHEILQTSAGLGTIEKVQRINKLLGEIRDTAAVNQKRWWEDMHPQQWRRIFSKLKPDGKFPEYKMLTTGMVPNYKAHTLSILKSKPGQQVDDILLNPVYEAMEKLGLKKQKTLEKQLLSRMRSQAEYLKLVPYLQEAAGYARELPTGWNKLTEHLLTRLFNMPSAQDAWTAKLLENSVGHVLRAVGKPGTFNAKDVMNIARRVNDFTYMGFLGFKPFSAMRNLFQPIIMVPTDMGGIKDLPLLSLAYRDVMFNSGLRETIRKLGVIPGKFTDEVSGIGQQYQSQMLRMKAKGQLKPSLDEVRSAALLMFGWSHNTNCYVSAAAAIRKWDSAVKAVGPGNMASGKFMKKAGVSGRRADIKDEIETLLRFGDAGANEQARKMFVRSVVEDTQFIYSPTHTPLVTQSLGGIGRTAAIFQTWWMNYGTTIHKWLTTGTLDQKAIRGVNAVLSGGMAYGLMRQLWDKEVAAKTVFAGPFPSPGDLARMPPAWEATYQSLRMIPALAGLAEGDKPYGEKVQQQIARAARTTFPLIMPGGLQLKQTFSRASKEGVPGLMKSLVRYKDDE